MIYCYYDKNGVLREIINNESTRQGTSESRAIIRVYFELHKEITDMTALYKTGDYTTETQRYSAGIIETIVPYNAKINYKYFKDNTPYTFFEFEIPSDILEKGANDFSTNVSCTFTPYYNNEEWDKLGLLTFNLQASVLNIDDTLTTSQMDYLLAEISRFEFIKNNGVYGTTDTSIVDGANAYSVHTNGCFVLQYVGATSQSVPAKNIAGIRFYRVVNNKYSLLYSSVEETDILYKLEKSDITQNYQITTLLNDVARLKEVFLDFATKEELSRVAFSGNYNDLSNKPTIPTQLSELTNNTGFITNAVSDLVNYYKKTETFTKDEITAKLNAIKTIKFEIYASLDDISNPQANVIYLIGSASPYKEYAYIERIGFEQIGSTSIDLSNYVQSDSTLNTDYVVLGNADKKVKTSSYKIETSSLNNSGIPTTHLVQTELRKYHEIITINGDSGSVSNIATHTPYRIIVDENLLVYRRVKNGTNPVFEALELVDKKHTKTWFLTFVGNNYTRTSVENVDHNEFDELVANTPTEITYNKETKVAQLTHDGQPIGEGAIIDLDGFTPYFDGSGLVLSDLEHAENDLATKQDKLVSGQNIKTINNQSILGSGNITIEGGSGGGKVIVNATETNELDSEFNIKNLTKSGTGAIRVYKLDRDLTENDDLENLIIQGSLGNLGTFEFVFFKDSVFVLNSINTNYTPIANLGILNLYGVLVKGELGFYFVFQFSLTTNSYVELSLEPNAENTVSRYDTIVLFQLLKNNLLLIDDNVFTLSAANTTELTFAAFCFDGDMYMLILQNETLVMLTN